MSMAHRLVSSCQADGANLRPQAQARTERRPPWRGPLSDTNPAGEVPGYDDDFQRVREGVNRISGTDSGRVYPPAENLLITVGKEIRAATYYCWPRLYQEGGAGFAEGLEWLAGLLRRYGVPLHPQLQGRAGVACRPPCSGQSGLVPAGGARWCRAVHCPHAVVLFEVKSRCLRLLRIKAARSETDKSRPQPGWICGCPACSGQEYSILRLNN